MIMRDPNMKRRIANRSVSSWAWLGGALLAILLIGGIALFWNAGEVDTTSNNTGAAAPATTGSTSPAPPATPSRYQ